MTLNCQAASKSAEFMLLAPVKGSKSEDMYELGSKGSKSEDMYELGTHFFLKNIPILIRRVVGLRKKGQSPAFYSFFLMSFRKRQEILYLQTYFPWRNSLLNKCGHIVQPHTNRVNKTDTRKNRHC